MQRPNNLVIDLQDVFYQWDKKHVGLTIDKFQVSKGERLFIQGKSGSGKTTLLGILGGVLKVSQGDVNILDKNLAKMTERKRDHFRADHLGIIFQMFNLIPYLSVIENVILPCQFSKAKALRALTHSATVRDEAIRLLDHLGIADSKILNRKVIHLSVGQQQRVAAARAFLGGPEIVIADEPTSALDEDTKDSFIELLLSESKKFNSTIVFVGHDRNLAKHFSRTIFLSDINRQKGNEHGDHHVGI